MKDAGFFQLVRAALGKVGEIGSDSFESLGARNPFFAPRAGLCH